MDIICTHDAGQHSQTEHRKLNIKTLGNTWVEDRILSGAQNVFVARRPCAPTINAQHSSRCLVVVRIRLVFLPGTNKVLVFFCPVQQG